MSIPICILNSNNSELISNETIRNFRYFVEIIIKKRINNQNKQNTFELSNDNSKKIFNWFSNLSLNERIQICTIHNKWLSNLIKQLLILYECDNNCCLNPLRDFRIFFDENDYYYFNNDGNYYNLNHGNDMNFFSYFLRNYIQFNVKNDENKYNEIFLNNLKFFSYEEPNDTITISKYFLKEVKEFKKLFDFYTENNFLKSQIDFISNKNDKIHIFKFPKWLRIKKHFSIFEIIIGYIEQNIILNYEYYHYTNKIYENKVIEKMNEIEELNKKLENFLIQEFKDEESFFSLINNSQIKYKIQENSSLVKEINSQRNLHYKIFSIVNYQFYNKKIDSITDEMIDLVNKKMKDLYKQDISQFLYNISFVSSEDVISYNRPFYAYTFNYIIDLFQNKNVNELIEDFLDEQSLKKKKHKKKKKKNKDKKEEIKNIEIKINEKKDTIEENVIDNKNDEKIEVNNLIINSESVLENHDIKKKKHKNYKKEFFLYPTNQSKKKKEEHKEKETKNNQINNNNKILNFI